MGGGYRCQPWRQIGTVGRKSREKDLTLAIALKTGKYIEDNLPGVTVIYTRKNDTFVELYRRAEIANKAKADLFIQFISAAV
ncbi:MAG: N-acetylmuramoyl-L-alanine amidase [Bacteroidales bacterium]